METEKPAENATAEKLQQELNMRGRYYFKGLGMVIGVGLLSNLEVFVEVEATQQRATYIHNCMEILVECYASIPFDQITDHPDYDILSAVRKAISDLQLEVNAILAGKKDITEAHRLIMFILLDKGNEYRERLRIILDELRAQPGFEDYTFKTTDVFGQQWDACIF